MIKPGEVWSEITLLAAEHAENSIGLLRIRAELWVVFYWVGRSFYLLVRFDYEL